MKNKTNNYIVPIYDKKRLENWHPVNYAGEYFINYHKDEQNNYISATKAVISMDLK